MSLDTANAARGRWPGILQTLGIDPKYLRDVHGPCPACGGKDRFRFDDKLNGNFFCTNCGAGDGFVLLGKVHGWDFKKSAAEVDRVVGNCPVSTETRPERTEEQKMAMVYRLGREGQPIDGTPAGAYLLRRCGAYSWVSGGLSYHHGLKHSPQFPGAFPALLAAMRYRDGKLASIQRVYLTLDGQKAPVDPVRKIMPGRPLPGSSVQLAPAAEIMGVSEGIETAICAGNLHGVPVWAAISANGMESWEAPEAAKRVLIFGDNDTSHTGQAAAEALAKRLVKQGIEVEVLIPPVKGTDWADVAMAQLQEVA